MTTDDIEASKAPLIEHLAELRTRLMKSIIALAIGLVLYFFTVVNIGLWGGFFLAFPFIAAQIWGFIAPGLYSNEKGAFLPFLLATPFLFVLGASLAYFVVIPLALDWLIGFAEGSDEIKVSSTYSVRQFLGLFGFGICFQLPVLLTLLGRVGIVSSEQLANSRK